MLTNCIQAFSRGGNGALGAGGVPDNGRVAECIPENQQGARHFPSPCHCYGDIEIEAAFIAARNTAMNSNPLTGLNDTDRSPDRETDGTSAAWSARA